MKELTLNFIVLIFIFYSPNIISPDAYEDLTKIEINGVNQWIYTRTNNLDNPIILYLHGGPGTSSLPLLAHYNSALEDEFIVVNWDQRGSGKSYDPLLRSDQITIDLILSDLEFLVDYLKTRFNKDKIFLIGHSWGSYLGVKAVLRHPENYYAYISVGQVVNSTRNEQISYNFALQSATAAANYADIWALKNIGYPQNGYGPNEMWDLIRQRYILYRYRGAVLSNDGYDEIDRVLYNSSVYSLYEKANLIWGSLFVFRSMWNEFITKINLDIESINFEVPVYFCVGMHDFTTPYQLAIDYFNRINAPDKELYEFEESAHCSIFEEPEKFNRIVIDIKNKIIRTEN